MIIIIVLNFVIFGLFFRPNSYFASATRNGYPAGLDPRFPGAFKASAATPFLMTGPQGPQMPTGGSAAAASTASASSAAAALSAKEPKEPKQSGGSSGDSATGSIFGGTPAANLFPPMLDMSSTQALLHMVRTANAAQQSAAELESYLKGANKRETSLSSPLDLSSPRYARGTRLKPATQTSCSAAFNITLPGDAFY